MVRLFCVALFSLLLVYTPLLRAQADLFSADFDSPVIEHQEEIESVAEGVMQAIMVRVTDNNSVESVTLFYRQIGAKKFSQIEMLAVGQTDNYSAAIPTEEAKSPGIEYYIESSDDSGNVALRGNAISPLKLSIAEPIDEEGPLATSPTDTLFKDSVEQETSGSKWLWITLGLLAVGGVAAASGGGGSSDSGNENGNGGGGGDVPLTITVTPP